VPLFSLDRGGLAIGVEEIPLVEEIVPVDLFVDDCDSFLFISSILVSRYYHGVLTLNPNVPYVLPLFFLPLYSSISLVWMCIVI